MSSFQKLLPAAALSAALLASDFVIATLVLLNIRAEIRFCNVKFLQEQLHLQKQLSKRPAILPSESKSKSGSKSPSDSFSQASSKSPSRSSSKIPVVKYFINRLSCIGVLMHLAWSVDPAGLLNLYNRIAVIVFAVIQLVVALVGLSIWFTSWMWILLKDWDFSDDSASKLSICIWMFSCMLPLSGLLAAAVSAFIGSQVGVFYGCLSFLYLLVITSTVKVLLSSFVAYKVYRKMNFRPENKHKQMYILKRQVLLALCHNAVLALLLVVLQSNVVRSAIYSPESIPAGFLVAGAIASGVVWYIAPFLAYIPRVSADQFGSRNLKSPTPSKTPRQTPMQTPKQTPKQTPRHTPRNSV